MSWDGTLIDEALVSWYRMCKEIMHSLLRCIWVDLISVTAYNLIVSVTETVTVCGLYSYLWHKLAFTNFSGSLLEKLKLKLSLNPFQITQIMR